jgi:DNA-damage-inducible protein D
MVEDLPPAEDIKKLERRVAGEEKTIAQSTGKLPRERLSVCK